MKQEIVIEDVDYNPSATRSKDLSAESTNQVKSQTLKFRSLRNLKKHIRNNAQTEIVIPCPLGKETKSLSLRLLKGIIRTKSKMQKIRLAFNTTTMKQEIVVENMNCNRFATTSKDRSAQSRSMNKLTELSEFDQIYQRQVTDTPIFNCSSCETTFFKRDIFFVQQESQAKQTKIRKLSTGFENVKSCVENCYICKHCKRAIEHETIAKYAVPEQIRRNNGTRTLTELTELEERLVSLRFPFLQIKEMGHRHKKSQLGLTGGVINVPTNISRIQSALPQTIKDTDTVAVVLKKSLRFKSAYAFGRVRVHKVMKALKQL